jgi:hypothetical protein
VAKLVVMMPLLLGDGPKIEIHNHIATCLVTASSVSAGSEVDKD